MVPRGKLEPLHIPIAKRMRYLLSSFGFFNFQKRNALVLYPR
jgi:hypothetical protein